MVMFLGACLDKDAPIMCITEYMPGGDLERYYMAKRREKMADVWCPPLWRILEWCSAVARALAFLHHREEPLIHRDLKPLNLLLNKHLEVKVADMGISKVMAATNGNAASYTMTGGVGSWLYMAPEVVRHEQYNEKVDIYAFGLIMYFMSSGRTPFYQLGRDPELAALLQAEGGVVAQ
ncbi:STY13 [Symbiodinium pilosum]|uniref:STY13 protein n=1 Tax=Symbiodinium pilosum TaxID=2952 RepID=A0A812LRN3_SYMPI|nr:STY13 [Symbiodinium pilosum]